MVYKVNVSCPHILSLALCDLSAQITNLILCGVELTLCSFKVPLSKTQFEHEFIHRNLLLVVVA